MLTIQRHNEQQPWGFRLQGGKDFRMQLSIKKVERGSPCEGALKPGDAILAIGGNDATTLTHGQAQNLIKAAGNMLQMTVRKGWVTDDNFRHLQKGNNIKFSPATAGSYRF